MELSVKLSPQKAVHLVFLSAGVLRTRVPNEIIFCTKIIENGAQKSANGDQNGTKGTLKGSQCERKGAEGSPKEAQREPNGTRRSQKGSKGSKQGAKRRLKSILESR